MVTALVTYYNDERLHSAIGYVVTPRAMLEGRAGEIAAARREKLAAARQARIEVQQRLREQVA